MFFKEWPILIVDDEPNVLRVSELAMRNWVVYGSPLKIHTALSKAEAIDLLSTKLARQTEGIGLLAVAFIDVVMETDTAGLELCAHIREAMNNKLTQIYVRTGQPGIAPERSVIDRYDINGYFTKVEATEDKLYTLVKSGVRQFYFMMSSLGLYTLLNMAIAAGLQSREQMERTLMALVSGMEQTAEGGERGIDRPKNVGVDRWEARSKVRPR